MKNGTETEVMEGQELTMTEAQREVAQENRGVLAEARKIAGAITNTETYQQAGNFLISIKARRKRVEEVFGPVVKKAYDAWKAIGEIRKMADKPLDEAEQSIKPALSRYDVEQESKRREEEARIRAEQRVREEEARKIAAEEAMKEGDIQSAEEILSAPPMPVAPVTLPKEKIEGISYRESWKFEIVNPKLVPLDYQMPDEKKIGQMVRAMKGETKIPGVRVWMEKEVAARSK